MGCRSGAGAGAPLPPAPGSPRRRGAEGLPACPAAPAPPALPRGPGTSGAASGAPDGPPLGPLGLSLPQRDRRSGLRATPVPLSLSPSGGLLSLPESFKVAMALSCGPRGGSASPEGGGGWRRPPSHPSLGPASPGSSLEVSRDLPSPLGRCACVFQSLSFPWVADLPGPRCCVPGTVSGQRTLGRAVFVQGLGNLRGSLSKQTWSIQGDAILCLFAKSICIPASWGAQSLEGGNLCAFF